MRITVDIQEGIEKAVVLMRPVCMVVSVHERQRGTEKLCFCG